MNNDQRILQLLESMLDADSTPEQVCAECPELLPAVKHRWKQFQGVEAQVEAMFPSSIAGNANGEKNAPLLRSGSSSLPGYEIRGVLGRGGMGVVYRAQHLRLNRTVALKTLLSGVYASPAEVARFSREARLIAELRHPHLVQVYDVGECDGCPYFTMELVEGGSLAQLLAGVPQAPAHAAKTIAILASAVQAAHNRGIVHRDLKPSNILLTDDGIPKISDFGLARRLDDDADLTLSGARIGTPSYMAPEQFTNRTGEVGPLSDIYSLGAILYEMLTGRPPFRADTVIDTERQVILDEPVAPSRLNSKVPRDLETICLKCLQKDPRQRYGSATALGDDLHRFQNGEPIFARPVSAIERAIKWARRRPTQAVLLTIGAVLIPALAGGSLLLVSQRAARTNAVEASIQLATDSERRGQWAEARIALLRAQIELADHGPSELHRRLAEIDRDLNLVAQLDAIHMDHWAAYVPEGGDPRRVYNTYLTAFKNAGIDLTGSKRDLTIDLIKRSPIRQALLDTLNDWIVWATPDQQRWLLQVARESDEDQTPWRRSARDWGTWQNKKAIEKLVADAPIAQQPISLLLALGTHLETMHDPVLPFLIKIQQQYPDDFWVNGVLGAETAKLGNVSDSIRYYQAAVAIRPASIVAKSNLACSLKEAGHADEAIATFRKVVAMEPSYELSRHNLIVALLQAQRYTEALEEARSAVGLIPRSSDLHNLLEACLTASGKEADANQEQQKPPGINLSDMNYVARIKAGGNIEQNWLAWTSALKDNPPEHQNWSGYLELSLFLRHVEEYQQARTRMLLIFGDTNDPHVAERVGRACLLMPASPAETRQAVALIDRAVSADKSSVESWAPYYFRISKGFAEYREAHFASAISILQGDLSQLLRPAPQLILAMARFRLGQTDEARKTLAAALPLFDWTPRHATEADQWMFHVLRREAEKLINGPPATNRIDPAPFPESTPKSQ
jgi:serine/threonine-protein kinase